MDIAHGQQNLFLFFLTRHFTGDDDFVALDGRLNIRITQADLADVFLQLLTGIGIARRQQIDKLFACFFHKAKNTHGALSLGLRFQTQKPRPRL
ncbi:hypothetical protein D3C86_1997180 [compost metagenome]